MPRSFCAAIATTAKASLISNRSTSPTLQPILSNSLRMAGIGAVVNHCGSWLWVAWPLISASTGRPSRSASERFARMSAAAPSALAEEAAGVIGVLQPIHHHVVDDLVMAGTVTAARLGQQIGCIAHALHAAGQHDRGRACMDDVVGQHGGLHAGAADLVDRRGAGGVWQF